MAQELRQFAFHPLEPSASSDPRFASLTNLIWGDQA